MRALASALSRCGVVTQCAEASDGPFTADLLIVDSYRERADNRRLFSAPLVAGLDDLARDLDVDVVIDGAPGASSRPHTKARNVLAGPQYAIIDPAIIDLPRRPIGEVREILVATGGADESGTGAAISAAIRHSVPPAVRVRFARGPWSAEDLPEGVEIIRTDTGLADYLACSDLVITAGGVTLIESLALGRPTLALVLHANQERQALASSEAGAVAITTPTRAANDCRELLSDRQTRVALAAAATKLIDGRAAERVAFALVQAVS
jgi:spore coat polysaccharide biosynthesis predicted glycosyltransferase SpsG